MSKVTKIMSRNAPLEPLEQKALVRSTATILGKIDRIREYGLTSIAGHYGTAEEKAQKAGEYQQKLWDLIAQRNRQVNYLQQWGTKTRLPAMSA